LASKIFPIIRAYSFFLHFYLCAVPFGRKILFFQKARNNFEKIFRNKFLSCGNQYRGMSCACAKYFRSRTENDISAMVATATS